MKNLILLIILSCTISTASAQLGGARVNVGLTTMTNQDLIANPEGTIHSGFHVGMDGRLMSGGMSFLVGGRYTSVSRTPQDGIQIIGHDSKMNLIHFRFGLDITLYRFSNLISLRTKALGSINLALGETGTEMPPPGYTLNGAWFGAVSGLGLSIGPMTLDVEYEYGFINAYNEKKESTFNSLSVSLGFFF